jgi:DNA gyrase/topoisomerase IV subunit A
MKLAEENQKLKAKARELKTELKSTTEVLKVTKTELQQEKKAFTGFATGLQSAGSRTEVTEEKITIGSDLFTPKKVPAEDATRDVANFIKLISDIKHLRQDMPEMTTAKGRSLAANIQTLLKKVEDYGSQFIDVKNVKITTI